MRFKYLIIGNSAGGIGAAEAIREIDRDGSLAIISDEPYSTYSRPLISKYLSKERAFDTMLYRPTEFYEQKDIASLLGKRVTGLDPESHVAELSSGEKIEWEKLLLATGGTPIVPPIKGADRQGVFSFTTFDDAKAIDDFLDGCSKAVVIGGGLIGVSVTEALVKRGIEVSIVEMKERILNTMLDEQASSIVGAHLEREGIEIVTGHTVTEISGKPSIKEAVLDNGERIPCDFVVVAIGVKPRAELASTANIEVNQGIVVDRHMCTSCPDIYSCGDVAEAYDFVYGSHRVIPIWPSAYLGGRVAGRNMAGVPTEYAGTTAMNSLNYFGLDIVSAGMVTPLDDGTYETITKQADSIYKSVLLRDEHVVGIVFIGDIEKSGIIYGLMKDQVDVSGFKQKLVEDDFGLVSLPRKLWQELVETAPPEWTPHVSATVGVVENHAGE